MCKVKGHIEAVEERTDKKVESIESEQGNKINVPEKTSNAEITSIEDQTVVTSMYIQKF